MAFPVAMVFETQDPGRRTQDEVAMAIAFPVAMVFETQDAGRRTRWQ